MNELGQKIKEARKKNGLSQEDLAELSKVNLRTIQRIENNQNEPRGSTLHLICYALDINAEDILDYGKKEDKNFLIYFHLSVLVGLVIPLGNIILPFIVWMNQRDKIIGLRSVGARVLNFQISFTILYYLSMGIGVYRKINHLSGANELFLITFLTFYILTLLFPIINAIIASRKPNLVLYPPLFRFIR